MDWFASQPIVGNLTCFLVAALLIGLFGTGLSRLADQLADRTGLGEAFVGAVLLGASTSLPGITASVTAALAGDASLALSNCFGGIAVQTLYLAIADLLYRHSNLEHASASLANLFSSALLLALLALILFAVLAPEITVLGFHPVSVLTLLAYLFGLHLLRRSEAEPMWRPRITSATRLMFRECADHPDPPRRHALR